MESILYHVISILKNPAFVLGIIAFIGLLSLKRSFSDCIKGTVKTILGFLILQVGAGAIVGALIPFSTLFTAAFGFTGIVAEDNSLVAAVQQFLGIETALIMLFSFIINILLAKFTKWKYIFLTGHMMFSFAGTMAILFDQMGFSRIQIIIFGSIIQGISMVLFPAISQPMVRKVTGNDNVAFGFWGSSLVTFCGYLGGLVGNKEQSSEDVKVSNKLDFLKDMGVLMSIVMVCVYLITSIFAGKENLIEITGESSVVSFSLMTALNFVAGILVLLQGVRMFLGEIVPAFKGFSDKIVPGAKPALDVPIFYSYAPIAVTIGFLSAMAGGILVTFISKFLPVTVLPSVIGLFFMGGAAGVFGNTTGGRRGAVVSGFLLGFLFSLIIALAYPLLDLSSYNIQGLWFASTDAIIVVVIIRVIGFIFGIK